MPVQLKVFGTVRARLTGHAPRPDPLTQPRPLALLAYLVLARPRGFHSRETLVELLWPEADRGTGRQGLRNALHRIRSVLGQDLLAASGDTLVGVVDSRIVCDALELERAVQERRWEDAVALYVGEVLQGFHVGHAPDFERWLDSERDRLRNLAVSAARSLAVERVAAGDLPTALSAARAACEFSPYDERSLRQLLELMAAAGDGASALRVYDRFAQRLSRDLETEPSPATQETVRAIRAMRPGEAAGGPIIVDVTEGASALPPPPVAPVRGDRVGRRRALVATLVAVALAGAWFSPWRSAARNAPAPRPAALDPSAGNLPERWRADTASLGAYLKARAQLNEAAVPEARLSFEALVKESPLYAPGWAGLSVALYRSGFFDVPPREAMSQAVAAASRALALDPELPEALETLIAYDLFDNWDLDAAKERLDSAIARYPGYPEFYNLLATWHRFRGELDLSLDLKEENADRDPLTPRYAFQIASSLYFAHRCAEAEAVYRRLPVEIRSAQGNVRLYRSLACEGKRDEAAAALREAALEAGDTSGARALAPPLSPAARDSAVQAVFRARLERELARRRAGWSPPEDVMLQYAELQNADSTLLWLDSMYAERSMMLYVVPFDPLNDFLRDDPRFQAFLDRLPWLTRASGGSAQ